MKTGNAIIGVFFIWMAFFFPIFSVIELAKQQLLDRLPVNLYIFVFVPFAVFIALGVVALFFGRERRYVTSDSKDIFSS
jgi:hypothetical protein